MESRVEDFDVRSVVLQGALRAVVWDTLACPKALAGVVDLVEEMPLSVIYSHGDWDHVWGTDGLSGRWEEIIAHGLCGERFADEIPRTLAEKRSESPDLFGEVQLHPPTRAFEESLTVDLGGVTLELHHLPGHTQDTIVGWLPEWGVFLAGDAVETPVPFLNPGSPVAAWAQGLDRWFRRMSARAPLPLVVPSHGPVGGIEIARANLDYLRALLNGEEPEVPRDMAPFYRETHSRNLTLTKDR